MGLTDHLQEALSFALECNRETLDHLTNVKSVRLVVKMDRAGECGPVLMQPEFESKMPMRMLDMPKRKK